MMRRLALATAWPCAVLLTAALATLPRPAGAAAAGYVWPQLRATEPVDRSLVVKRRYEFWDMLYDPPVAWRPSAAPGAGLSTPEDVLMAMFTAMSTGDTAAFATLWDGPPGGTVPSARSGGAADDRLATWRSLFAAGQPRLYRRVELGRFVILTYKVYDAAGAPISPETPIVCRFGAGGWKATAALDDQPLLRSFGSDASTPRRVVR